MNYLEQYNLKYNVEIDLAYLAYQKIVFEYFPNLIQHALDNNLQTINFSIKFAFLEPGLSGTTATVKICMNDYTRTIENRINLDELKLYILQLSSEFNENSSIDIDFLPIYETATEIAICAPTIDLINFYYEELQREEYETNRTR